MKIVKRMKRVWLAMPALYDIQPTSEYWRLTSHSAREIDIKAWNRTGDSLRLAIRQFERKHPDVKRRTETTA